MRTRYAKHQSIRVHKIYCILLFSISLQFMAASDPMHDHHFNRLCGRDFINALHN